MVDDLKIKHLNKVFFISATLISIINLVSIIYDGLPAYYLVTHVAVLAIVGISSLFIKRIYIYGVILALAGVAQNIAAAEANLTAVIFFLMADNIFNNGKMRIAIVISLVISTLIKCVILRMDLIRVFTLLTATFFVISTYIILHKSYQMKLKIVKTHSDDDILNLLISGKTIKEIAFELHTTYGAVNKHMQRLRLKFNCKSYYEMIYYLTKSGHFNKNIDNKQKECL